MKSNLALILATVAVVIAIAGYTNGLSDTFGASGTRFPNGISADTTSPTTGQVRGTTLTTTGASTFGGTVTVTTSNAATSTVIAGCIQTYATSTLTPHRWTITDVASATSTVRGTDSRAYVVDQFGSCP